MTQSKYSSLLEMAIRLSQSIHLFALKAFDAACRRWSTSQVVDFPNVVGIVPCTRNINKPWTFIFENFAYPLWALRRTFTGHSHGMKFCTLGMNEQHTVFGSRRLRAGRECVVVLHWIRRVLHWQPVGQRRLGRPKLCWESKLEMYCRYQGLVHGEVAAQNCELWKQHFNTFLDFCCQ